MPEVATTGTGRVVSPGSEPSGRSDRLFRHRVPVRLCPLFDELMDLASGPCEALHQRCAGPWLSMLMVPPCLSGIVSSTTNPYGSADGSE